MSVRVLIDTVQLTIHRAAEPSHRRDDGHKTHAYLNGHRRTPSQVVNGLCCAFPEES